MLPTGCPTDLAKENICQIRLPRIYSAEHTILPITALYLNRIVTPINHNTTKLHIAHSRDTVLSTRRISLNTHIFSRVDHRHPSHVNILHETIGAFNDLTDNP
jgi:hypothetical protein